MIKIWIKLEKKEIQVILEELDQYTLWAWLLTLELTLSLNPTNLLYFVASS